VPLKSEFKPQLKVLSRKPAAKVVQRVDPVTGLAKMTLEDEDDEEEQKKDQPSVRRNRRNTTRHAQEYWVRPLEARPLVLSHLQQKMGERIVVKAVEGGMDARKIDDLRANLELRSFSILITAPILELQFRNATEEEHGQDNLHQRPRIMSFEHPKVQTEAVGEVLGSQIGEGNRVDFLL
jgi:hypothetical protein